MQLNVGFWVVTLAAALGLAASVVWTIARGASASALSAPSQRLLIRGIALLMALWATIVVLAAEAGAFQFSPGFPIPFIGIGVAAPIVIGALIFALSPALRAAVAAAPQENIIGIQAFRALGIVFIILLAEKRLPAEFALPAGIGDVLVGLAALPVAYLFASRAPSASAAGVIFNLAGILDLVTAVGVGFFASTTPLRLILTNPSTDLLSLLPLVSIPAFGVPLFAMLHFASLQKIFVEARIRPMGRSAEPGAQAA
jgi:hypothetical protein